MPLARFTGGGFSRYRAWYPCPARNQYYSQSLCERAIRISLVSCRREPTPRAQLFCFAVSSITERPHVLVCFGKKSFCDSWEAGAASGFLNFLISPRLQNRSKINFFRRFIPTPVKRCVIAVWLRFRAVNFDPRWHHY